MDPTSVNRPLRILLAEDGSENAQAAVSCLCELPLPDRSEVLALGVLNPLNASNHTFLEASLKATQTRLQTRHLNARAEIILGYPSEKIIEIASEFRPDLIVMGAKGRRATPGILVGGVAQQTVEYANRPVFIVRSHYTRIRSVLLVLDRSAHSQLALRFLAGEAGMGRFPLPGEVEIHVLHVLLPTSLPDFVLGQIEKSTPFSPEAPSGIEAADTHRWTEEEWEGDALLSAAAGALKTAGFRVQTAMPRGDAATEILKYIRQHGTDLVIAGSRGMSPVKAWLLGSVSRKLIHYAPSSVLIVRGETGA